MILPGSSRWQSQLLKTAQVTSQVAGDDGALQKGVARSYTVLTSGQYSGTFNIDLAHYTSGAGAVTFNNTLHTIVDTGNGLAIFKTNDVIVTDSASNPGPFTITTGNVAGTIAATGATFVNETPAGTVTISKREAHNNACVLDNRTGLMWSRTMSSKMGLASNGTLEWTPINGRGIFEYATACNAGGGLAGYTNWRIPNINELFSLINFENAGAVPDTTAWPTWPALSNIFSSTTKSDATTYAWTILLYTTQFAKVYLLLKNTASGCYVMVVRG